MEHAGIVLELATRRKSVRVYSSEPVDVGDVLYAIATALQAPSGANQQPWSFTLSTSPEVKAKLRKVCEDGKKEFYKNLGDLRVGLEERGFNWSKPFITEAPVIVAVFAEMEEALRYPEHMASYWLHAIGIREEELASLTYIPPNSREIREVLRVPDSQALQTLIPVGHSDDLKPKEPRKGLLEAVHLNYWGLQVKHGIVGPRNLRIS